MTEDEHEDLLDTCHTRRFLDNFKVDVCTKCGRGDTLTFYGIQALLQYRSDAVEELEPYED